MKNITIKDETHKKLKKIAERENISMSAFLDNAVAYFNQTKINPKTDVLSVKEEIIKLEKRTNQVIGFIRTFENENLKPMFEEIKRTNKLTIQTFETLPRAEDVNIINQNLKGLQRELSQLSDGFTQDFAEIKGQISKVYLAVTAMKVDNQNDHIELLNVLLNKQHRISIAEKYNIIIKGTI